MGGWNKGKRWTEAIRRKISESNKGKHHCSEETCLKMSLSHKGKKLSPKHCLSLSKPAWNKGIPHSEETKIKISNLLKGRMAWNKGIKCPQISLSNKGRRFSEEHLRKLSESHKDHIPSQKTRLKMSIARKGSNHPLFGKPRSPQTKEKLRVAQTGKKASEQTLLKMRMVKRDERFKAMVSKTSKQRWANNDYAKRVMKKIHAKPNFTELKIDVLLQSLFLGEYRYVGSGDVWIGGKNPDFINVNGQKKIIEFFGHRWHKPEDEEIRKAHFRQYGFETLIIWGNELKNIEILKERLRSFHEYCIKPV